MKISLIFIASIFVFLSFQTVFAQLVLDGETFVKVCNGYATYLPQPKYLHSADYDARTHGESVSVQILINDKGEVESATAVSGHPYLRPGAEQAARQAKFRTSLKAPKKVSCILTYVVKPEDFEEVGKETQNNNTNKKPRIFTGGPVCNFRTTFFPQPIYPKEAKEKNISGSVYVRVSIDEDGNVTSAETFSGHPLLRKEARKAALKAKFKQTKLSGVPVKVSCGLVYNFLPDKTKQTKQNEETPQPYFEPPIISLGVVNDKAKVLPMPILGEMRPHAVGSINVEIKIDLQKGKVISAMAYEGHPLIRNASVKAALQAEFEPSLTEFSTIYGKGILIYKFEDFNGKIVKNNGVRPLIGVIGGGIVNGKATYLPQPVYPPEARESCANGSLNVRVLIDEDGKVISAKAFSGDEILRKSAEEAAKKAKFRQSVGGYPVKIQGIIVYNFDPLAKCINAGIVNKKALNIPKPSLPQGGHPSHLKLEKDEIVVVQIVVNMDGKVTYAKAISGHPLLRASSEMSARRTTFPPTFVVGSPMKVKALLAYKLKPDRMIETDIEKDDKDVASTPINLVKPPLSSCNCKFGSNPKVTVVAKIDERGNVVEAEAISGHPILRQPSKIEPLTSIFVPTGEKVKLFITYHFAEVDKWSVKISKIEIKHSKDLETKGPVTIRRSPSNTEPILEKGIIVGTPINLPKPALPPTINWKAPKTAEILVEVEINKEGYVVSAKALTGHIVLKGASVRAARRARFTPTYEKGKPIEAIAKILYKFVFDDDYKFDSEILVQSIEAKE